MLLKSRPVTAETRTRMRPTKSRVPLLFSANVVMYGLTSMGSMGSESVTEAGTVSIMRPRMSAHLAWKVAGSASAAMVALPSAPKTRLSELFVSFFPTTRRFCVVPSRYSVTTLLSNDENELPVSKCTKFVGESSNVISGKSTP